MLAHGGWRKKVREKLPACLGLLLAFIVFLFAANECLDSRRRRQHIRQAWLLNSVEIALAARYPGSTQRPAMDPERFARFCEEEIDCLTLQMAYPDGKFSLDGLSRRFLKEVVPLPLVELSEPADMSRFSQVSVFLRNRRRGFPPVTAYLVGSNTAAFLRGLEPRSMDPPGARNGILFFETAEAMWKAASANDISTLKRLRRTVKESHVYLCTEADGTRVYQLSGEQLCVFALDLERAHAAAGGSKQ